MLALSQGRRCAAQRECVCVSHAHESRHDIGQSPGQRDVVVDTRPSNLSKFIISCSLDNSPPSLPPPSLASPQSLTCTGYSSDHTITVHAHPTSAPFHASRGCTLHDSRLVLTNTTLGQHRLRRAGVRVRSEVRSDPGARRALESRLRTRNAVVYRLRFLTFSAVVPSSYSICEH